MIGTTFAPGATDDGGGVSRQGLAWYATRCAAVLPILWRGARERNGVRGEGRGAVPRAWGARESARRTNVNGNVDLFILWHLLCVLLTAPGCHVIVVVGAEVHKLELLLECPTHAFALVTNNSLVLPSADPLLSGKRKYRFAGGE